MNNNLSMYCFQIIQTKRIQTKLDIQNLTKIKQFFFHPLVFLVFYIVAKKLWNICSFLDIIFLIKPENVYDC